MVDNSYCALEKGDAWSCSIEVKCWVGIPGNWRFQGYGKSATERSPLWVESTKGKIPVSCTLSGHMNKAYQPLGIWHACLPCFLDIRHSQQSLIFATMGFSLTLPHPTFLDSNSSLQSGKLLSVPSYSIWRYLVFNLRWLHS